MLYVGFEPTIQATERAKGVHALDSSATVTVHRLYNLTKIWKTFRQEHKCILMKCQKRVD
jgi:hypothetical protein